MASLVLAALFFAGIHLGIAGTSARDAVIARWGPGGYYALFSAASVEGLAWLIWAYSDAPYDPTWGMLQWWKPVAIVLMLPSALLVVLGVATPNPTSVAQVHLLAQGALGVVRVTRHPFLVGVALWALVHLVGNGDVASLLFFGSLAIVACAGTVSIDAKRRKSAGAAWDSFEATTSIIPFAAIAAGHNRFDWREIGLWRWATGIAVYAVLLGGHANIIGISPFP